MNAQDVVAPTSVKSLSLEGKVFRADGSLKEDLGVLCYWHRNPLMRLWFRIKTFITRGRGKVKTLEEMMVMVRKEDTK